MNAFVNAVMTAPPEQPAPDHKVRPTDKQKSHYRITNTQDRNVLHVPSNFSPDDRLHVGIGKKKGVISQVPVDLVEVLSTENKSTIVSLPNGDNIAISAVIKDNAPIVTIALA